MNLPPRGSSTGEGASVSGRWWFEPFFLRRLGAGAGRCEGKDGSTMTRKSAAKDAARARQSEHGGKYEAHLRTVGGGTSHTKPWTCDVCKKPIASGDGYVLVMDAKTRNYPRRPTPEGVQLTPEAIEKRRAEGQPTEPPWGSFTLGEIADKPDEISFVAYHKECDPDAETNPYWISVERAETLEQWCGWVHHLCEKTWMSKHDIRELLGYWFENRGQDPYELAG
jgi:hypothetical protein